MTKKIHNKLICFFAVILLIFSLFGGVGGKAYASFENYTDVLADLQKDKNFNINDYPAIENNYSLQVITIAESTDGELFVYVYQPSANVKPLTATEINMSLTEDLSEYDDTLNDDNGGSSGGGGGGGGSHGCSLKTSVATKLYDLMLININGVFAKYKVTNFKVSTDPIRYYNITSIYRDWVKGIDAPTGNDNEINGVAFEVGKLFTIKSVGGKVDIDLQNIVLIKNPFVGFLRYFDGIQDFWGISSSLGFSDLHYIAFDTNWKIDELLEANVSFYTQSYSHKLWLNSYEYGEDVKHSPVTLTGKIVGNSGDYFLGQKYEWKEIQSVEEFKKIDGLDATTINAIGECKWVMLFDITDVIREIKSGGKIIDNGTKVSKVSVLRLKFMSDGYCYNLGAVSNSLTGSNTPGNSGNIGFWAYIWRCIVRLFNGTATLTEQIIAIVFIFLVVLVLPILLTVLSFSFPVFGAVMKKILKGIWLGFKYFFIGLWYVISSPVWLIIVIVHKIKNGG